MHVYGWAAVEKKQVLPYGHWITNQSGQVRLFDRIRSRGAEKLMKKYLG